MSRIPKNKQTRTIAIPAWIALTSLASAFSYFLSSSILSTQAAQSAPSTTYDAGSIFATITPSIEHNFTIANNSNKALKILNKTCTCTCTSTDLSGSVIAPRGKETLKMSLRTPQSYSGPTSVKCILDFDNEKSTTYTIKYTSYGNIKFDNDYIYIDLDDDKTNGNTNDENQYTTRFHTFSPVGQSLPILESISQVEGLDISLNGPPKVAVTEGVQHRQYQISIKQNNDLKKIIPSST